MTRSGQNVIINRDGNTNQQFLVYFKLKTLQVGRHYRKVASLILSTECIEAVN